MSHSFLFGNISFVSHKAAPSEGVWFLYFHHLFHPLQAYSDGIPDFPGPLLPEQEKKKGRNKRAPKGEKPPSRYKKRKKEGDERQLMHSGPDSVMTQIKQVG